MLPGLTWWRGLVHYVIYTAGIPVARTMAFIVGAVCTLIFGVALLQNGL
jgi:uncharacterized MAPEG superfamily protein